LSAQQVIASSSSEDVQGHSVAEANEKGQRCIDKVTKLSLLNCISLNI
jgi:hypothetical protein